MFNRQKFVYPPGINAGSEFQTNVPVDTNLTINTTNVIASVNDVFQSDINSVNVVATVANAYNQTINSVQITNQFSVGYTANVNAVNTSLSFNLTQIKNTFTSNRKSGYTINFPTQMVPQPNIPVLARTFRTRTASQLAEDNNIS